VELTPACSPAPEDRTPKATPALGIMAKSFFWALIGTMEAKNRIANTNFRIIVEFRMKKRNKDNLF
jgi:hypothetical protein